MKPLVSVIVAVYNVAPYLEVCLDSLSGQTYQDVEFLLVDDGSTDGSGDMCDRRSASDPRFRTVHRRNGGLSAARNTGLESIEGKWVAFVDGDDVVSPTFVATLLSAALSGGSEIDIVTAGIREFSGEEPAVAQSGSMNVGREKLSGKEMASRILYQRRMRPSVCDKLFRARLFVRELFTEGILYEDLDIIIRLLSHTRRVIALTGPGAEIYYYRQRSGSIVHTFSLRRLDVLDVTERNTALVASLWPDIMSAATERQLSANFNMLMLLSAHGHGDDDAADRCWAMIKRLRLSTIRDPKARLKSRVAAMASLMGRRVISAVGAMVYKNR